jgi:hypothetical protein
MASVLLDEGSSQPVGILVELLEGRTLGADKTRREGIRHIPANSANPVVDHLDL